MKNKFIPYLSFNVLGIALNFLLIHAVLTYCDFQSKSYISVMIWSLIGYSTKTWLCSLPLLRYSRRLPLAKKILLGLSPFLLMLLWYVLILALQIEVFYVDFSFGYIQRFPHGLIQLLTILVLSLAFMLMKKKEVAPVH